MSKLYVEGYLAAMRDLRAQSAALDRDLRRMQDIECAYAGYGIVINGIRNGLQKFVSDFEISGCKKLAEIQPNGTNK